MGTRCTRLPGQCLLEVTLSAFAPPWNRHTTAECAKVAKQRQEGPYLGVLPGGPHTIINGKPVSSHQDAEVW